MVEGYEEVTNVSAVSESVSSMCESNLDGYLQGEMSCVFKEKPSGNLSSLRSQGKRLTVTSTM